MNRFAILFLAAAVVLTGAMAYAGPVPVKHALLFGKVDVKTENNAKVVTLTVSNAMGEHFKHAESLAGKTLRITGPKTADFERFAGKEIETTGILSSDGKDFESTYVLEKNPAKMPSAPHAIIIGRAEEKTVGNSKQADIVISSIRGYGADSKALAALKGRTLQVTGPKAADVEKLAGKEIEATGLLEGNNSQVNVSYVTEWTAPVRHASSHGAKPMSHPASKPMGHSMPAPVPAPAK